MSSKAAKIVINLIYPMATIAVLLVIWYFFYLSAGSEFIFPSPQSVIKKIFSYLAVGYFWQSFFSTLSRVIATFLIALLLAAALGTAGYFAAPVKKIIAPYIKIMVSAPTVAVMLILNMMLVKSTVSPVIVALTIVFPMTYSAINAAFAKIDVKLIEMAKIYKVPLKKRIFSLILPSVLPYVAEQASTTLSFTLKIIVSSEIIAFTYKSLGGILNQANTYLDMAGVLAITIISVVIAIAFEYIIKLAVFLFKRRKRL